MVTPEAPVKVVKIAQTNVAITATPPGIHPKSPLYARTRRLAAPPSARTYPATVRSGMAGRDVDETTPKMALGTDAMPDPSRKKRTIARPLITMNTGAPRRNASATTRRRTVVSVGEGEATPSRNAPHAAPAATARYAQRSDPSSGSPARHAKRSAMTAKPAGITSWLQATRIPNATT